jgi:hypothetical protein
VSSLSGEEEETVLISRQMYCAECIVGKDWPIPPLDNCQESPHPWDASGQERALAREHKMCTQKSTVCTGKVLLLPDLVLLSVKYGF